MKMARYLSISILGFFLAATGAGADPAASEPSDNPYSQLDPDGVPLSVTQPQQKQLSAADREALIKQEEQASLNKNWLLRSYEQQLQAHDKADTSKDQAANLYYQLSLNKDLAKLAGLPSLDSDSQESITTYRTGVAQSGPSAVALRPDVSSTALIDFSSHDSLFKPVVTPLSAPDAAGMHNFYSSLPLSMAPPFSSGIPQPSPAPRAESSEESSDLETPGMVSAPKDALTESDLTLDILPGESIEEARAHQDNASKLELQVPMDANQLHKEQTASLSVPGAPTAPKAATSALAPVKVVPTEDPDAPMPVDKVPPINPVRAPIANPYDILNR